MDMGKAGVLAVAMALAAPGLASAGALELDFGSSDAQASDTKQGTHLNISAEVPLSQDVSFGFAANSNSYDTDGATTDTLVLGLAAGWKTSDALRMSPFYEHVRRQSDAGTTGIGSWGIEAGYEPGGPIALTGYLGRYSGDDWAESDSLNYGVSARSALGKTYSAFVFLQRDTYDGGWWQDQGAGLDHRLDDRGLGLSMRYTLRDSSAGGAPERSFFFGGSISVGAPQGGSAREFRAHHCVICERPV